MMDQLFSVKNSTKFDSMANFAIDSVWIRMHFVSEESRRIFILPFAHLAIPEGPKEKPDLEIYVLHGTRETEPLAAWQKFERDSDKERQRQLYSKNGRHLLYQEDSKVLTGYDSHAQKAYYYIPALDLLPFYEKAAPMRMIFHHLAQAQGWSLVHSASVGLNDKGILLIGAGGSGKTTTALSAAFAGFSYLGDDYVLLNPLKKSILSLYQSGKFRWDSVQILKDLEALAVNPRSDKKGFFFLTDTPAKLAKSLPFSGIVIPRINGGETTSYRRIPSTKALLFLSASTIFQMPGSGKTTLQTIKKAIRQVPAYEMELGTNPNEINARLIELIKGL